MLPSQGVVASSEAAQSPGVIQSLEAIRDRVKEQLVLKVPEYRAFQAIETSLAEISHIQDLVDHLEVGKEKIKDRLLVVREYRAMLAVEKSIIDIAEVLGVLADTANSGATAPVAAPAANAAAVPETAPAPEATVVPLTPLAVEVAPEAAPAVTPSEPAAEAPAAIQTEAPAAAEKPEPSPLVAWITGSSGATSALELVAKTAPIPEAAAVPPTPAAVEAAPEAAAHAVMPSQQPEEASAANPTEVPAAETPEVAAVEGATEPVAIDPTPTHEQSQEVKPIALVHDGNVTEPETAADHEAEGLERAKVA